MKRAPSSIMVSLFFMSAAICGFLMSLIYLAIKVNMPTFVEWFKEFIKV